MTLVMCSDSGTVTAFRDSFQKGSVIYKFLRNLWIEHPLFLNRCLTYNPKRRGRLTKANLPNKPYCYFNWVCNNEARSTQKTKTRGFICPWCERDYYHLDSLIAHLRLCHPRFQFDLVEDSDGQSVIEMSPNGTFDTSYCGFKYPGHDLKRDFRFTPRYPKQRIPQTQVIFFRSKKKKAQGSHQNGMSRFKLLHDSEFLAPEEGEADVDVCSSRLYYHTSTCLPIKPNEVDLDSEADTDPQWLKERTELMIDEFIDVNEGEKEIMKLWNLHIMKYKCRSDKMIRQACLDFVKDVGHEIFSKDLTKNLILHMANFYDFGLLSSEDLLICVREFKKSRNAPCDPNAATSNK